MQNQTTTLRDAARARSRTPYVQAIIEDKERRWTLSSSSGIGSTMQIAACLGVQDPTKIIRARVSGTSVQVQVITDPTQASQYNTWPASWTCASGSNVAIGKGEGATEIYCYYWKTGYDLVYRISTDDGASWGTQQSTPVTGLTIIRDLATSGHADLYYTRAAVLRCRIRSSGAWSAEYSHATITDLSTPRGAGACADGSTAVVAIAYLNTASEYCLKITTFNLSTPAWGSDVWTIYPAGTATNKLRPYGPNLVKANDGSLYLSFCDTWTDGTNAERHAVIWKCVGGSSYGWRWWGVPVLLNCNLSADVPIPLVERSHSGRYWLWAQGETDRLYAKEYSSSDADMYLATADILAFHLQESDEVRHGWLDIANRGNIYQQFGTNGQTGAPIKPLAQVTIRTGYKTSAGNEYCSQAIYWIESAELIFGPDTSIRGQEAGADQPPPRLRLNLIGAWRILEQWNAPYPIAQASATVIQNLRNIMARASGLEVQTDGSALWNIQLANYSVTQGRRQKGAWRWRPEWTAHDGVPMPVWKVSQGTNGFEAVQELLRRVGGAITWKADYAYAFIVKDQSPTTADYTVGANGEIESARYGAATAGTNRARIIGGATSNLADGYADASASMALGRLIESAETRTDMTTASDLDDIAEGIVKEGNRERTSGQIELPLVPGLELWDRLEIIDARMGWTAGTTYRRAIAITSLYSPTASRYHQYIALQNV